MVLVSAPPLDRVEAARTGLAAAEVELVESIRAARAAGASWAAIGLVFGISRQAAWERFAARVSS